MNINNFYFPEEVFFHILSNSDLSLQWTSVCKAFYNFFPSFMAGCQSHPLLKDRLNCLPSDFSGQQKIKAIYQNILKDVKREDKFKMETLTLPLSLKQLEELDSWLEDINLIKMFKNLVRDSVDELEFINEIGSKDLSSQAQAIRKRIGEGDTQIALLYHSAVFEREKWPPMSKLPKEISFLPHVLLNFCDQNLTHLPPDIGMVKNLNFLYLKGNQLLSLPPEIKQLTKLMKLYLSYHQIDNLKPYIDYFTQLGITIEFEA